MTRSFFNSPFRCHYRGRAGRQVAYWVAVTDMTTSILFCAIYKVNSQKTAIEIAYNLAKSGMNS